MPHTGKDALYKGFGSGVGGVNQDPIWIRIRLSSKKSYPDLDLNSEKNGFGFNPRIKPGQDLNKHLTYFLPHKI